MNIYHLDDIPEDLRGFFKPAPQLGLESTPQEYVAKLVAVFREVRRVLKPDGVLWLNLGDSYAAGGRTKDDARDPKNMRASGHFGRPGAGRADGKVDARAQRNRDGFPPIEGLAGKQLVGIPWRVAFALQQPYYTGRIKDERWRFWLAALFDGEGCFGIRRQSSSGARGPEWNDSYIAYAAIKMSDRAPLDKAAEITGMGEVRAESWRIGEDARKVKTRRVPYVWRLDGNKAAELARELYPYLLIKQNQAACICALDKSNKDKRRGRGNVVPDAVIAERERIFLTVKAFNQRSIETTPDWLNTPEPHRTEQGWWLRQDIIWSKPNPMPESVTDRPTKSHEYIYLFAKSERYFYNTKEARERAAGAEHDFPFGDTRNMRSVWTMPPIPFADAHFATFPPDLARRCILAGSRPGDTILDPFSGSGTSGEVAQECGRNAVLIEISPKYVEMARRRTGQTGMVLQ